MTEYLQFLGTTIGVNVGSDAEELFRPVRDFFSHLLSPKARGKVDFQIDVAVFRPDTDVPPEVWETPQQILRRSKAPEFNLDAHVVERDNRRHYVNRETLLDTPVDATRGGCFRLLITAGSTIQALDFIRDLVIRHEETRGTVVLHASGIVNDDGAVLIAGPKGAGKTTTMLSALHRSGWEYFTGDKAFCEFVDGNVLIHPWRDYPYVGVGSIRADPRLTALVRDQVDGNLDERADDDKVLIHPDLFDEWMGIRYDPQPRRLRAVFLPEVRPGDPLRVVELGTSNERRAHLNKIIDRQADSTFFTWQNYLVPDYMPFFASLRELEIALAGTPFIRLVGTLDVDPGVVFASLSSAVDRPVEVSA